MGRPNDLVEGKTLVTPEVTAVPLPEHPDDLGNKYPGVFSVCTMTHARSKQQKLGSGDEREVELSDSFMADFDSMGFHVVVPTPAPTPLPVFPSFSNAVSTANDSNSKSCMSRKHLISEQKCDQSLTSLFDSVVSEDEIKEKSCGYFMNRNVLMLKWTPPSGSVQDDFSVINQIVVPQKYRDEILKLAHEISWSSRSE